MNIHKIPDKLTLIGLTMEDVSNLRNTTIELEKNNVLTITKDDVKEFDLNEFVRMLISNEELRTSFVNEYMKQVPTYMEISYAILSLDPFSYHTKWNLFLTYLILDNENRDESYLKELLNRMVKDKLLYFDQIDIFLEMKRQNLNSEIDVYNLISKANELERSGWVTSFLPLKHLESIAEHMYNMYTLMMLYLPNTISSEKDYDKNKVLTMIMIHDVAETITGDIPRPLKKDDDEIVEDLKAEAIWCALAYYNNPFGDNLSNLWREWEEGLTINARIAHDADNIQLVYQFLTYCVTCKNVYPKERIYKWTRVKPKTEIGKKIYNKVIMENPRFDEVKEFIHE